MKSCLWITGASSGIGEAIADKFLSNNHRLLISARREQLLENKYGKNPNAIIAPGDVSDYDQLKKTVDSIQDDFEINCLINNAGITSFEDFSKMSIEEIHSIINTNLLGSINCTKLVIDGMKERKSGMIINILSIAAKKIFLKSSIYSAAKSGLLAFTNVLREELRSDNIKIVNVLPGAIDTPIWDEKIRADYSERMMNPKDIADVIYTIYSNDSSVVFEEVNLRPIAGDL